MTSIPPVGLQLVLDLINRDLMFSVKPKYANLIMSGVKTVELRRRFSGEAVIGTRAFIYATSPAKAMIGYVTIADVRHLPVEGIWQLYASQAGVTRAEFEDYFLGVQNGYVIELKEPRRLRVSATMEYLKERFGFRAPQSYQYAGVEYRALIG